MQEKNKEREAAYIPMAEARGFTPPLVKVYRHASFLRCNALTNRSTF